MSTLLFRGNKRKERRHLRLLLSLGREDREWAKVQPASAVMAIRDNPEDGGKKSPSHLHMLGA